MHSCVLGKIHYTFILQEWEPSNLFAVVAQFNKDCMTYQALHWSARQTQSITLGTSEEDCLVAPCVKVK